MLGSSAPEIPVPEHLRRPSLALVEVLWRQADARAQERGLLQTPEGVVEARLNSLSTRVNTPKTTPGTSVKAITITLTVPAQLTVPSLPSHPPSTIQPRHGMLIDHRRAFVPMAPGQPP